jgi:N-acetyl-alpha-D-muramate 1-phosphate uridylyltransferase
MKAMILAAGKGTRLLPLTEQTPKALIRAGGVSLLERLILRLKEQGFRQLVVNVHHHAGQIIDFLKEKDHFGLQIDISDESELLLDTGGAILRAAPLLGDDAPFLVHNVDIISDIDLAGLFRSHQRDEALATLAVRNRKTTRYLLFDSKLCLRAWENLATGERIPAHDEKEDLRRFAFSGIHVISPAIFRLFTEKGRFSIINTYLRLCREQLIRAYRHDEGLWIDAGKPKGLAAANRLP